MKEHARLDGIVTLVDAMHIEQHLDEEKPEGAENEAVEQVAFADRLLLNKVDLVSPEALERVEARLRGVNKYAPITRCVIACAACATPHPYFLQSPRPCTRTRTVPGASEQRSGWSM